MHAAFLADILEHPDDDTPRLVYADWLEENGDTDDALRAEFIRVQVKLAHGPDECLHRRERELWEMSGGDKEWLIPDPATPQHAHICLETDVMALANTVGDVLPVLVYRRGFVERVRFPLAAWLEHGPALVAAYPVQRVEPSDRRPYWNGYSWAWHHAVRSHPSQSVPDAAVLPVAIWSFLAPGYQRITFTTEAEAWDAASVACLAYAQARNKEQVNG